MKKLRLTPWSYRIAYENEGDKDKKFTQEDVNRFLAEDKRKHKEQLDKTLGDLKILRESGLTAEQKQALEERIHALETENMTKEELAERERKKLMDESETQRKTLETERDQWKLRYTEATISQDLISAAVEHKAINPKQVLALLRDKTRLTEAVGSDGKPSGKLISEVEFTDTDKKGNPIKLVMKPSDAVKRMKELVSEYGNLFVGDKKSGSGGSGNESGDGKSFVSGDQASYAASRKALKGST